MRTALRLGLTGSLGICYVSLFWLRPPKEWPSWLGASRRFLIDQTGALFGVSNSWAWVLCSLLFGAILPAALLGILASRRGGRPSFLGVGTRDGWRLAAIGYAIALPPLLWLASRPDFRAYYAGAVRGDLLATAARYGLVLVAEHVCIQGLILRLAVGPAATWPPVPRAPEGGGFAARGLRLLALGQGPGLGRALGVDGAVLGALVVQAGAFGWVHLSKDLGELALSFPGGFAVGYLAWRARSVWPCVLLHALTGVTVIVLAKLFFGMPSG